MTPEPDDLTLWLAFDQAARAHAGAVALIDRSASVSYDQLHARALGCAARLAATLHGSGAVVALVGLDPASSLAWLFGALHVGASVVPVAANEPDRNAQLRLLRPDVTVSTVDGRPRGEHARIDRRALVAEGRLPAGIVVCTAGTTGVPKAVVHSHVTLGHAVRRLQRFRLESAGLDTRAPANRRELTDDLLDAATAPALGLRYATTLPITTMAGLTVALQALLAGDCLVLPSSPATAPELLLDTIAATGVTNVSLTPLLAQLVLRARRRESTPPLDQLLFVGIGGGPVVATVPEQLEEVLGCPVAVGYGTTEAGGALTMGRISDPPDVRHATVGRVLPGVELSIDPGTDELIVDTPSTAVGYLSRLGALTALDRGPYPTRDLARIRDDGAVELCGRIDGLILRGGRNIDPVRIERALEDHPAVQRAAAFGRANPSVAGEQDIWTVVVLDGAVDEIELRAHCNQMLGASLTPRRVIAVDALPLTADGAVRRHELAQLTSFVGARP